MGRTRQWRETLYKVKRTVLPLRQVASKTPALTAESVDQLGHSEPSLTHTGPAKEPRYLLLYCIGLSGESMTTAHRSECSITPLAPRRAAAALLDQPPVAVRVGTGQERAVVAAVGIRLRHLTSRLDREDRADVHTPVNDCPPVDRPRLP